MKWGYGAAFNFICLSTRYIKYKLILYILIKIIFMGIEERPELPIESQKWTSFHSKIGEVNGKNVEIGFTDPDGNFYAFKEGEKLVHIKNDQGDRDTFIQKEEDLIPFDEWKQQQKV